MISLLLLIAMPVLTPAGLTARDQPNIIILFADDLGIGDVACLNPESRIPTPRMDEIAKAGMRFTDAHAAAAVCTPSRYALLTGRYPWRSSLKRWVLGGGSPALLEPGRPTLASVLSEQGYRTACIGKWHLGLGNTDPVDWDQPLTPGPRTVGFDEFYGISASLDMPPYVFIENERLARPISDNVNGSRHRRNGGGGFWRAGPASEDFDFAQVMPQITDRGVDTVRRFAASQKEDHRPFFIYIPFSAPHTPWVPTESFQGRTAVGHYGDFVAQVDDSIGRIAAALQEAGVADETMLIVTSDNGGHWPVDDIARWGHDSNMGLRGQKADIHEGGHRIPLLIRWPGVVEPDSLCEQTVCLTDLYATCLAAAGSNPGNLGGEDSLDITPLLRSDAWHNPREAIIHQSGDGMLAIRSGRWKLIESEGSGGFTAPKRVKDAPDQGQLYDLTNDPAETRNVWLENPDVVARLQSLLTRIKAEGRTMPAPISSPRDQEP